MEIFYIILIFSFAKIIYIYIFSITETSAIQKQLKDDNFVYSYSVSLQSLLE